jgi:hypothetical protein
VETQDRIEENRVQAATRTENEKLRPAPVAAQPDLAGGGLLCELETILTARGRRKTEQKINRYTVRANLSTSPARSTLAPIRSPARCSDPKRETAKKIGNRAEIRKTVVLETEDEFRSGNSTAQPQSKMEMNLMKILP